MLYADDAGFASRSPAGLAHMMTVVVEVFSAFGLSVSEKKTETLIMRVPGALQSDGPPPPPLVVHAAGQTYAQTHEFRYLGGMVTEDANLEREIAKRAQAAWCSYKKYATELFDRPTAPWHLKVRLLKAEAMEALLYGCMTWAPRQEHYRLLRTTHHRLLLRIIGYQRERGSYRQLSYAQALKRTGSESVEATVRRRRLLFAGAIARQPDDRLPKRLLFGQLTGGSNRTAGRPEHDWLRGLRDDFKQFGATAGDTEDHPTTFGVDGAIWTVAAKRCRGALWHKGVHKGAEMFMSSWHAQQQREAETRAAERQRVASSTPADTTHISLDQRPDWGLTACSSEPRSAGITTAVEESRREAAAQVSRFVPD